MSDEPETVETETVTPSKHDEPISKVITIGLLVAGAIWGYYKLDEFGYISHSKLSEVHAKGWSIGEYKDCNSMNTKDEDIKLTGEVGKKGVEELDLALVAAKR